MSRIALCRIDGHIAAQRPLRKRVLVPKVDVLNIRIRRCVGANYQKRKD
jgi:hypothetical protein